VELNRGWGVGYGVVEAVVEAVDASADGEDEAVEAPFAGTIDGLASMITVRVLVAVSPYLNHDDVEAIDVSVLGSLRHLCGSRKAFNEWQC
jgi:hypothetical protein